MTKNTQMAHDMSELNSNLIPSDALVFFGATGDLAHKKIFPSLYQMVKRGVLKIPVIGVGFSGWNLAQLRDRAKDGITHVFKDIDANALNQLLSLLRYVDGDYKNPQTFQALKQALDGAVHPTFYLAIPPAFFAAVIKDIGSAGLTEHARIIVEKPFGRDLASARELNDAAHLVFPETSI